MPATDQTKPDACSYPGCVLNRDHPGDHEFEGFRPDDPTTGQMPDEPVTDDPEVARP